MNNDKVLYPDEFKKKKKPRKVVGVNEALVGTYNIVDHVFYTLGGDMQPVLIVMVEEQNGRHKVAYMGTGKDKQWVASWGTKLSKMQAEAMFGYVISNYRRG